MGHSKGLDRQPGVCSLVAIGHPLRIEKTMKGAQSLAIGQERNDAWG